MISFVLVLKMFLSQTKNNYNYEKSNAKCPAQTQLGEDFWCSGYLYYLLAQLAVEF
jgi:hypothetical protein